MNDVVTSTAQRAGPSLFAERALETIPKILTLQDRDPHSPTYGCFDRAFWHYRLIDFPSGMAQELVLPLALAWAIPFPGNRFYQQAAVREWIAAGIHYAASSSRKDGSCDDYFPHERALGAATFSLYACVEAARRIRMKSRKVAAFVTRRADWLADHQESGRLSNHEALCALALDRAGAWLGTSRWRRPRAERLARVLTWQDEEGWFQEYEGCDPGYNTLTLGCLALLHASTPSPELEAAIRSNVLLLTELMHPDGSFGGEHGSRNTYAFFPHGFEIVGRWMPEALPLNDRFLEGLARRKSACHDDDRVLGHQTWSYLLAFENAVDDRPDPEPRRDGRRHFPNAGIIVDRRGGVELFLSHKKGGTFKLFRDGELVASDTHLSLLVHTRTGLKNAVGHLVDDYPVRVDEDTIEINGKLGWAKRTGMNPSRLILLRIFMGTIGRFGSDLVRRALQRLLITGKRPAPIAFLRRLTWSGNAWEVHDELDTDRWDRVRAVGIGGHQTSIYVVMSRVFQEGQMQPWCDLTPLIRHLTRRGRLVVDRVL